MSSFCTDFLSLVLQLSLVFIGVCQARSWCMYIQVLDNIAIERIDDKNLAGVPGAKN